MEDVPWMVSIGAFYEEGQLEQICGGTLIDPLTVATAAHCAAEYQYNPENLSVTVGRKRLTDSSGAIIPVAGIIVHPQFDPNRTRYDIALLKLAEPVNLSEYPQPISAAEETALVGASAVLYGWGYIYSDVPVRPNDLQSVTLPLIDTNTCAERLGLDFDPVSMLCAGKLASSYEIDDGIDACNGDSGGPLISYAFGVPKLLGIVSWGFACGSPRVWGAYTRVSVFHDWIASNPQVPPFPISGVSVSGVPAVGQIIKCEVGKWGGVEPTTFDIQWVDTQSGPLTKQSGAKLRLSKKDIGRGLSCVVTAKNAGGEMEVISAEIPAVFPQVRSANLRVESNNSATKIGSLCKGNTCSALIAFQSTIKQGKVLYVNGNDRTALWKPQHPTTNSMVIRYRKGGRGTVYIRALLERGKTVLVKIPLG